jgi:isocitrate/isopropylmalate dehydrogenase
MMLRHFEETAAADAIERAIESVLAGSGPQTPDIGGEASTRDMVEAISSKLAG